MSRPFVAVLLAFGVAAGGCSKIVESVVGANPLSIVVPTAILADDTVQAQAISTHKNGNLETVSATWRSSDASVISIDDRAA